MRAKAISLILAMATLAVGGAATAEGLSGSYLAGRQASFVGEYKQAALYYERAIRHDPGNVELLERAVTANVSLGEMDQAIALSERLIAAGERSQIAQMVELAALSRDGNFGEILSHIADDRGIGPLVDGLITAWAQLGQGDMTSALVAFDDVATQPGLAGFAFYHKALALASVGDFEGAEKIFAMDSAGAMQLTRRGVMVRATILSQLDRSADAVALLDEVFGPDLDPGLAALRAQLDAGAKIPFDQVRGAGEGIAEVFYTLATALAAEANDEFTLLYARFAEFLDPEHIDAILLVAETLEQLGQYDLAVATYSKVPRENPVFHAAELGRANALRQDGKVDAAIEVLTRLSETHGDLAVVQSSLGDILRQQERYEDAVAAYDKALAIYGPEDRSRWFALYARGISHERTGNWENAEADFRSALEINPDQPQVLNYLGYSLVEKQMKLDEALDMIERAVAARPDSGYIVDSLGWVLYRLGRYDEAVEHMERAAELMPIDPVVNDHLGDVYWAVGRHLEARFQWKRALSFVDHEQTAEEVKPDRIRRKLEVGLDQVLAEEGAPPLQVANDDG